MPTGPSTQAQKINERKMTSGDNPTPRPITRGSIRLLQETLTTRNPTATTSARPRPNCTSARKTGGMAAMTEPMLGMKFKKKARKPHRRGKSTPRASNSTVTLIPVAALMIDLIIRYRLTDSLNCSKPDSAPESGPHAARNLRGNVDASNSMNTTRRRITAPLVTRPRSPIMIWPMADSMALASNRPVIPPSGTSIPRSPSQEKAVINCALRRDS